MLVCGATSNMLEELSGLGSICGGERMVGVLRRYPASGLMPWFDDLSEIGDIKDVDFTDSDSGG